MPLLTTREQHLARWTPASCSILASLGRAACSSRVRPTKVARPQLVPYAQEVVDLFDLTIAPFESDDFAQVFADNRLLDGKCHRLRGFFGTPCIDGSDGISLSRPPRFETLTFKLLAQREIQFNTPPRVSIAPNTWR
mgnify:CR=1 FL=1